MALARARTPALAQRWGYLMNMDLASFASPSLQRVLPRLKRLKVSVPEKHDLVLMKVLRGDEHDLQAIEAIHRHSPLELSMLVARYSEEMGSTIIEPRRLRAQFLVAIERLFPDEAEDVARRLRRGRGP